MNGPFSESLEEAILLLQGGDPDAPKDCHRHCTHWDTEGECCGCGEIRTPNHGYVPELEFEEEDLSPAERDEQERLSHWTEREQLPFDK